MIIRPFQSLRRVIRTGCQCCVEFRNSTAVNSAIEVDLTGRINSETAEGNYIGAIGGLRDFIEGANAAQGGRAIIALPATARSGRSRIVANVETSAWSVTRLTQS